MKMTYRLESRKRNKVTAGGRFIISILVLAIISLLYFLAPTIISGINPLWDEKTDFLSTDEQSSLENMVRSLQVKATAYDKLVGIATSSEQIIAKVTRRPPFSMFDKLILDRGSQNGIYVNRDVYLESIYLGKITEVYDTFSVVTLITTPEVSTHADIGGAEIVLRGQGNGGFAAELPRDILVSVGDTIYNRERDLSILGIVEGIKEEGQGTLQNIFVSFPVRLSDIKWVIIK